MGRPPDMRSSVSKIRCGPDTPSPRTSFESAMPVQAVSDAIERDRRVHRKRISRRKAHQHRGGARVLPPEVATAFCNFMLFDLSKSEHQSSAHPPDAGPRVWRENVRSATPVMVIASRMPPVGSGSRMPEPPRGRFVPRADSALSWIAASRGFRPCVRRAAKEDEHMRLAASR